MGAEVIKNRTGGCHGYKKQAINAAVVIKQYCKSVLYVHAKQFRGRCQLSDRTGIHHNF